MYISHINTSPINYILLGANTLVIERENDWKLHGRILAFIEQSDKIAHQDYNYWRKNSPDVKVIKELRLDTGLGHGFLYKPIKQWLVPTKDWI